MASNVKFYFGSLARYEAIEEKDSKALYFLTDEQGQTYLYKGADLYATGALASKTAAGLMSSADKEKLDKIDLDKLGASNLTPVDGSIVLGTPVEGSQTIGVAISKEVGNLIAVKSDGLFVATQSVPEYEIEKQESVTDGFASTYKLKKTVNGESTYCGTIDIPKDKFLQSATVGTVTEADKPYTGAVVGEKYLDFQFNDVAQTHDYIPLKEVMSVTAYTAGDGIAISEDNVISLHPVQKAIIDSIPKDYVKVADFDEKVKAIVEVTTGVPDASQFEVKDGVLTLKDIDADKITYNGKKLSAVLEDLESGSTWEDLPEVVTVETQDVATTLSAVSDGAVLNLQAGTVDTAVKVAKSATLNGENKGIAQNHAQEV